MSNDIAYRIYWVKDNMSVDDWRKHYEIRTGPTEMEVMLMVMPVAY